MVDARTVSGFFARRLEAEVSCRTAKGDLAIAGTTELRSVANGWEAEVDMVSDVQRGGDDTHQRVAIFVCRQPPVLAVGPPAE